MTQQRIIYIFSLGIVIIGSFLIWETIQAPGLSEDYLIALRNNRLAKDAFFRNNLSSPLTEAQKDTFTKLPYYKANPEFILEARYEARHNANNPKIAGTVFFNFKDLQYALTAFYEDSTSQNQLFIPFLDKTSAKETYGGGRYLNFKITPNPILLDFNYAYHPYCVYNETYVCPKPPSENVLPFSIEAGEKLHP